MLRSNPRTHIAIALVGIVILSGIASFAIGTKIADLYFQSVAHVAFSTTGNVMAGVKLGRAR